jgi:hypothetical protein
MRTNEPTSEQTDEPARQNPKPLKPKNPMDLLVRGVLPVLLSLIRLLNLIRYMLIYPGVPPSDAGPCTKPDAPT